MARKAYPNKLAEKFGSAGFKMTPQRMAVFEFLEGNTSHPSAHEAYKMIKRRFPSTSFATIYNTLNAARDIGIVQELSLDPEKRHYDPDTSPHHHIRCTKCQRIDDVGLERLGGFNVDSFELGDYQLTGFSVDFHGVCPRCRAKGH
jgi:Fur family peroxide stress response transcriptional regulator